MPREKGGLATPMEQIKFDAGTAKLAVPIGACLRRIARKVEGFKIHIQISRSLIPFELFTNLGTRSIKVFESGEINEFKFFQRRGVSEDLEVEFVQRLEESDANTENYKPYVLFKTKGDSIPMHDLKGDEDLWEGLDKAYGLETMPSVKEMMVGAQWGAFDPKKPEDVKVGINMVKPVDAHAAKEWKKVGDRAYTFGDMHKILLQELRMPQKIAWIEEAFGGQLPEGEVVHRYYLDSTKQLFCVRHHWKDGKRLLAAETDEKALEELPAEKNPFSGMH
jgi:hypothetical protein